MIVTLPRLISMAPASRSSFSTRLMCTGVMPSASASTSCDSGKVLIAMDDAGAGYSGLRHILDIKPDIIKLDMSLTHTIDKDATRHALATALISFGRKMGIAIVAEGVETASELRTLNTLGADCAQGYFLQRPMSIEVLTQFLAVRRLGTENSSTRLPPVRITKRPKAYG